MLSSNAVVFEEPGKLSMRQLNLAAPSANELIVDVTCSGISTGTEKLLWEGTMPAFPGLAYPLVPGYEAVGRVRDSGNQCSLAAGTPVFVPGASCYQEPVRGLFGASASVLVVPEDRVTPIGSLVPEQGVLLALAATAMHILSYRFRQEHPGQPVSAAELVSHAPDLIVGHGVVGRLLARLCLAIGAPTPEVWEINEARRQGGCGYEVVDPSAASAAPKKHIVDVSGAGGDHLNTLIGKLDRFGRITLGGFYQEPVSFNFPAAFMREATIGIAAEWSSDDLSLVMRLLESNAFHLDGLVTHEFPAVDADKAYPQAFNDADCLKTILHWSA